MNPSNDPQEINTSWQKTVLKYANPDNKKSIWQIVNSLVPYIITWILMYKSLEYSYWITLLLSVLASGFLIRLFIIFHDCGHNSFFRSKKANKITGIITGLLAFTPFYPWHRSHAIHHATAGNLDKRGSGDIWTLTVDEYLKSSKWNRIIYRSFRNPYIFFTFGSLFVVLIQDRFTNMKMSFPEKMSVYFTNAAILLMATGISLLIGIKAFMLIQMPVIIISHSLGLWLFYIQHQFDGVIWRRSDKWEYKEIALRGCSFLKLPRFFQWFTGNIGFHHVHHLSSRIPNYNLSACHYENDMFRNIKPLRFLSTFRALTLSLWDESLQRLISFKEMKAVYIRNRYNQS